MDGVKALEAMAADIMAMLENMPSVDVKKLRAKYAAEHADEIAAQKNIWQICGRFVGFLKNDGGRCMMEQKTGPHFVAWFLLVQVSKQRIPFEIITEAETACNCITKIYRRL